MHAVPWGWKLALVKRLVIRLTWPVAWSTGIKRRKLYATCRRRLIKSFRKLCCWLGDLLPFRSKSVWKYYISGNVNTWRVKSEGVLDLFNENFLRHKVEAEGPVAVILQWKFPLPYELDSDYENGVILVSVTIFSCTTAAIFVSWCMKKIKRKNPGRGCKVNCSKLLPQASRFLFCCR